nr:hypothetical protein [Tanacetum cinerariifolium]
IHEANPLHIQFFLKPFECLRHQTPHAKPWSNELKAHSGQRLSEDISQLILSPHKIQFNQSFLYLFSNEMVPNIDVLRPRVLYIVAADSDGTLVVTVQRVDQGGKSGDPGLPIVVHPLQRPNRLCALAQSEDDMPFHTQACKSTPDGVIRFCFGQSFASIMNGPKVFFITFPQDRTYGEIASSHISSNGRSQFGAIKIGASGRFCFNVWKALMQSSEKMNGISFSRSSVGNKMHKAFPLLVRKFPLLEGTSYCLKLNATVRRIEMPLPEICTAIEEKKKKLPVKDRWQLH